MKKREQRRLRAPRVCRYRARRRHLKADVPNEAEVAYTFTYSYFLFIPPEKLEVEMEVEGRSQYFVDAEMLTADFHYHWLCPTQMMLASRRHMMILHIKLSDINSVLSGLWAPWAGCSFPISICSNYTVNHGPRSFSVSRISHVGQE